MRTWIFLFLLVTQSLFTQSVTYAATVLSQGVRNVKNGAPYGGASAVGDGVHDDTQAIRDALYLGRRAPGDASPGNWPNVAVYLPPGNYLVSSILVLRGPYVLFGEPSNPPTITLKANSPFYASGSNPLVITDSGWGHAGDDYTTYNLRDGVTYSSTNNDFSQFVRDINFTVQAGNPGCNFVVQWATAQGVAFRNSVLTATASQSGCFSFGYSSPGGGGGGIVANVTCNGGQSALREFDSSYAVFRGCTFNGPVTLALTALNTFIACAFNNPGGSGFSANGLTFTMDDCPFTTGTLFNPGGAHYHIENSAGRVQETSTNVYYNIVSEAGTSGNLAVAGVTKGSPYANPAYPHAPATTVNVTSAPYNAVPGTDCTAAIKSALSVAGASLYFPPGTYVISSPITVGANQSLYGVADSACTIQCNTGGMIQVSGLGVGPAIICDLEITGSTGSPMLKWDADPSSQMLDCMVHPIGSGVGPCALFSSGGGLIEQGLWVADDGGSGNRLQKGPTITTTTGPIYFYALAPEHYSINPWIINNANHVYIRPLDFEIIDPNSNYVNINGGSNINISGIITGGTSAINYLATLTNNPQVSLWELMAYNGSPPGAVLSNGVTYGTSGAGTFLEGFAIPSAATNTIPSVGTSAITNLGSTSATFNANVTSNGNQTVTSDGFDWGTTTAYGNSAVASTLQVGSFSANLTGLTTGQIYHYRAKAVNSVGTGFSGDSAFTPSPTPTPTVPPPNTGPYKGTAAPVPGFVYASNYDLGGQGVGYEDSANGNPGAYRKDGVDLKLTSDTASAGTGYVLGWRTAGEWNRYTVNAQAGKYTVSARVESPFNTGKFHVAIDGSTVIAPLSIPLTGPWDIASSWKTVNLGTVTLTAGSHVVTVLVDAAWFDLNYLSFVSTATSVKYIQSAYAAPQTQQQTVPMTYAAAQTSGNLNVVIVGWNDTTSIVNSVKDSKGNVYQLAVGPTLLAGYLSQSIYYCPNILAASAGANAVTVTFTKPATYADIRILEYSGISQTNPVDGFASAVGNSTTSSSGALATTSASDLLIAANMVQTGTNGASTGFTQRLLTSDGDIVEDKVVTSIGTYSASTALSAPSAGWDMQIVAFRAASQ